jgi:hypothetical protein
MVESVFRDLRPALKVALAAHDLVCGAVISSDGDIPSRAGDFAALETQGLPSAPLGPYGSAQATFASIEGQLLPRIWAQGRAFAFVDRVDIHLAAVVFAQGWQDVVEQFRLSKRVSHSIRTEFGGVGRAEDAA